LRFWFLAFYCLSLLETKFSMDILTKKLLALPNPEIVIQEVQKKLQKERQARKRFYNKVHENQKAEFIKGKVIIHSPVMKRHNHATGLLFRLLSFYVSKNNLGFTGIEKIMVTLTRNDYEPDICFFSNEKAKDFTPDQKLFPPPDFVVEVLSKSTAKIDRTTKLADYEQHGVTEYWIVHPKKQTLEQYLLRNGKYELVLKATDAIVKSEAIKGFEIPIQSIFKEQTSVETLQKLLL
jgi:Uma2 family endonuclease